MSNKKTPLPWKTSSYGKEVQLLWECTKISTEKHDFINLTLLKIHLGYIYLTQSIHMNKGPCPIPSLYMQHKNPKRQIIWYRMCKTNISYNRKVEVAPINVQLSTKV